MNPQSTDKLSADANVLIPRVVYRGKITITTSTAAGATLFYGTASKVINELDASSQFMADAYVLNSGELTKINSITTNSNQQQTFPTEAIYFYLDSSGGKYQINFTRFSRTSGESRTIYYVVYSTKITGDSVL